MSFLDENPGHRTKIIFTFHTQELDPLLVRAFLPNGKWGQRDGSGHIEHIGEEIWQVLQDIITTFFYYIDLLG